MELIARNNYLDWLISFKDQQIIKVISGVRRCGKSTLFALYRTYLLQQGVEPDQILMLNFEDLAYDNLRDYRSLYNYLLAKLQSDKMNYIFLDEIQQVREFEKAVDSLFIKKNCDVYITGSNSYFMSGELATLLSGRYLELRMLPLSFREFAAAYKVAGRELSLRDKFNLYLRIGGFPFLSRYHYGIQETQEYLRDVFNTVLLKDVVARLKVADVDTLEKVTKFMLHNVGSRVSMTKIANTLKTAGKSTDVKTIEKYLRGLSESMLLYKTDRFDVKGRQLLATQQKYYAVDPGFRNLLVPVKESDAGHVLENIVYLELLRRGCQVYTGALTGGREIDFVAQKDGALAYYQVALSTLDPAVLERELAPYQKVKDNYPKYLLTLDDIFKEADYDGVQKVNLLDWLMAEP